MKNRLFKQVVAVTLSATLLAGAAFCAKGIKSNAYDLNSASKDALSIEDAVSSMILSEENYEAEYEKVEKSLDANKKTYSFKGVDDLDIYGESHVVDNAKGAIAMVHGFSDSVYTFYELAYYFNEMGYSVYFHDNRGHARSGRLGSDDYQITINHFDDYVEDYNTFIETIVKPECDGLNIYGYGQSMGGLIVTKYAEMYPDTLDKIVATCPLLGIKSGQSSNQSANAGASAMSGLANMNLNVYAPGQGPWSAEKETFENSDAESEARYNVLTKNPKLKYPNIACGGTTLQWAKEAYTAIAMTLLPSNIEKIKTPIFMAQAMRDKLVDNSGQDKFAASAKTCTLKKYDTTHSIHKSHNNVLEELLNDVLNFYED